jgi:glycosyltransferase involved in cell wall biosynthesis
MGNKNIIIHAANIKGLGTIAVAKNLLGILCEIIYKSGYMPIVYLDKYNYSELAPIIPEYVIIKIYKRLFPVSISRIFEIFTFFLTGEQGKYLILGDIPLFKVTNQTVFIQQPNLSNIKENKFSARTVKFRILRILFKINKRYVKNYIVQSICVEKMIGNSYSIPISYFKLSPHPVNPIFFSPNNISCQTQHTKLLLFYPASFYPHKNHQIILDYISSYNNTDSNYIDSFIFTTKNVFNNPFIKELGVLTSDECYELYKSSDALIFPSLMESYGLPLIEAMQMQLPIIVSDLDYAKWLCEDQAIYFNPTNMVSLHNAIIELYNKKQSGWRPNYKQALSKIHANWEETAQLFFNTIIGINHV